MNRANVGRPRIAWYCDGQSTTSKSIFSRRKFFGSPNMTSKVILPWDNAMEGGFRRREAVEQPVHPAQGIGVDDVDAAASVHEDATHVVPADLRVKHQGCVAWPGDSSGVIIPGEGDALLG